MVMRKSEVTFKWVVSSVKGEEMGQDEKDRIECAVGTINDFQGAFFGEMLKQWEVTIPKMSVKSGVTERLIRYAYISALDKLVQNLKNVSWKSGIDDSIFRLGGVLSGDFEFALEDEDFEDAGVKRDGFH